MSWSDVWEGVVQGVNAFGTGILQNYYNRKAQSDQNDVQFQMWQMNNAYNSPKSVMARLEEAGLNPNLVYGNGGASYQATMPTAAKRAPVEFGSISPLSFQQLENMEAQQTLLDQQTENAKTQNRILKANARVAEKDAKVYEDTGVRPGDSPTKSIWRKLADWFTFDDSSRLGHAINDTRNKIREVNFDKYGYSGNNSANVKFYD